jgi:hypothetical protein
MFYERNLRSLSNMFEKCLSISLMAWDKIEKNQKSKKNMYAGAARHAQTRPPSIQGAPNGGTGAPKGGTGPPDGGTGAPKGGPDAPFWLLKTSAGIVRAPPGVTQKLFFFFWKLKTLKKNYTCFVHIANIWRNIAFCTRITTINAIPRICKKLLQWSQSDPKMTQGGPKLHPNEPKIAPKNITNTQGYPQRSSEGPPKNAKETKVNQAW